MKWVLWVLEAATTFVSNFSIGVFALSTGGASPITRISDQPDSSRTFSVSKQIP